MTTLENDTAKSPPSRERAWMTFHFFSFVGVVLSVNRDAFLGVKMIRPAQDSFVLGDTQVSLWLLFTFLSSLLPGSWRFGSNSLLDLSSRLWSWISFTKRSVSLDIRVCNWLNCYFYSISVKNFHKMNFQNRSDGCAFGNSCQSFGFRIRSRTRIFSTQRSNCSSSVVCIRLNFVIIPSGHKMLEKAFSHSCVNCIFSSVFEGQRASLHPVSRCLSGRRYQQFHFFRSTMVKIFFVYRNTDSSFFFFCQTELTTPISNYENWTAWKQEFCIHSISMEVNGTSALLLLQDPTTQCSGTFEDRMTSFFESLYYCVGCAIPLPFSIVRIAIPFSLPTLDSETSNVLLRISSRNSWPSAFEIQFSSFFFHSVPLNIDFCFWPPC